jgi:hypothetical protein
MNLYQHESLVKFNIADLEREAIHAHTIRMARSTRPAALPPLARRLYVLLDRVTRRSRPDLRPEAVAPLSSLMRRELG